MSQVRMSQVREIWPASAPSSGHREQHPPKWGAWRYEKPGICTTCTPYGMICIFSPDIPELRQSYQLYQVHVISTVQNKRQVTLFGPWRISCPRHPAVSSTSLVLKSILQTIKCLQGCKQGNVAKPGAGFLQTTGRVPEFLGILSQTHELPSAAIAYSQTFNSACQKLNQQFTTKSKLRTRFPLQFLPLCSFSKLKVRSAFKKNQSAPSQNNALFQKCIFRLKSCKRS